MKGKYKNISRTEVKEFEFSYINKRLNSESIFSAEGIKSGRQSEIGNYNSEIGSKNEN